jgi:hypothetical protein
MKKIAFLVVLAVLAAFGSCSNEQKIVGTWTDIEGSAWVFGTNGKVTYTDATDGSVDEYQYSVFDGERKTELTIFEVTYSLVVALSADDQKYTMEYSKDGKTLRLTGARDLYGWSVAGPGWSTNQLTRK